MIAGEAFESFSAARAALRERGGPHESPDRAQAWERFAAAGLPHSKTEAWRYTPSAALWARSWRPASSDWRERAPGPRLPPLLPSSRRLVFINGRFEAQLSYLPPLSGVWIHSACSTPGPLPAPDSPNPIVSLNRALYEEAAVLDVAGDADAGLVEVLHLMLDAEDDTVAHPRIQARLGRGARLTLLETWLGQRGGASLVNASTEVELGPGARLDHVVLQDAGARANHLGALRVRQERDSQLRAHLFQFGAALARRELWIELAGEGARAEVGGLFVTREGQHHDQHVWIDHGAPGCTSRQDFRGLVSGHGRGVFTGHVRVRRHAQKTDAAQRARALLLSPDAEVDLRPHLEIHADDVKAAHGASVGELDREQLFYLRSRGIPEAEARGLLLRAFAAQALEPLTPPGLRERVERLLERNV